MAGLPDWTTKPALSVAELAALLEVHGSTVRDAIAKGEIPCLRVGRRQLIPVAKLMEMFGPAAKRPEPSPYDTVPPHALDAGATAPFNLMIILRGWHQAFGMRGATAEAVLQYVRNPPPAEHEVVFHFALARYLRLSRTPADVGVVLYRWTRAKEVDGLRLCVDATVGYFVMFGK